VFPDTFWLKAGIAQALPAFLHSRGLFLQEVQCKRRAARSALQEAHWQEAHCKKRRVSHNHLLSAMLSTARPFITGR